MYIHVHCMYICTCTCINMYLQFCMSVFCCYIVPHSFPSPLPLPQCPSSSMAAPSVPGAVPLNPVAPSPSLQGPSFNLPFENWVYQAQAVYRYICELYVKCISIYTWQSRSCSKTFSSKSDRQALQLGVQHVKFHVHVCIHSCALQALLILFTTCLCEHGIHHIDIRFACYFTSCNVDMPVYIV